jgi:uncharacterized protein
MIVDGHVYVKSADRYRREFSAAQILQAMDEAGVDKSVIFAMSLPSRESNDLMAKVCEQAPHRFIPFAHVVPTEGILASLEMTRALMNLGCRGMSVDLGELQDAKADDALLVARRCSEARIPLLIDVAGRIDIAEIVAREERDCTIIIAHLGSKDDELLVERTLALAYEHAHVYLDCSGSSVPWKIAEAIQVVGPDKVIWGSGGPLVHPAVELQKVKVLGLDDAAFAKVTGGNITRLTGVGAGGR